MGMTGDDPRKPGDCTGGMQRPGPGTAVGRLLAVGCLPLLLVAAMAPTASAMPPVDRAAVDRAVDDATARYHLPGIAVGVIEDGQIAHVRTAGEVVAGSGQPVTPDTLFKIASNSKAMTASVLARLVDAGRLRWDDPVVKHLPAFRMHDPWVTQHITVRDLLVHNSGLPEGGGDLMLWPEPNRFTRADILAGLAHIRPAYSFRSGYAYDNLLYVVAGEVAAAAGGASYEELVRREIFQPLGLDRCVVGAFDRDEVGNVAQPHARSDGRNVVTNADEARVPAITSAAAGGIRCSLGDMLDWARNWLAPDATQAKWLSPQQRAEMWKIRTPMPVSQRRRDWDGTHVYGYGHGFRMADVDGEWTVSHTGTLSGMYSMMMLLPDRRSGFLMLINGNADEARTVLGEVLLKQFTDPSSSPTVAGYAARIAAEPQDAGRAPPATRPRVPATPAELAMRLGRWRDPWFGEVALCAQDGRVRWASDKSPMLRGDVVRVGNRYLIDWDDDDLEAWLDFAGEGDAAAMTMAKSDPDGDFSYDYEDLRFARAGDCTDATVSAATTPAEADLVDIASLVPDIALDIRYAGRENFVGAPVDGYEAPKCYLRTAAAEALARIESDLRRDGLRLKLFDCYRPARAVAHFVRWAADLDDQRTKAAHYPDLDKRLLLGDYIAPVSGHSRGFTVDLTLQRCEAAGRCAPLDMGTPFDFFDPLANTADPRITGDQRANRARLVEAMRAGGFANYAMEWWHYTLDPMPSPAPLHDVLVR